MASRLAEIYRSEKKSGGGLGSAIGKTIGEKIDPRRALDQSGLLVSMFPSLKAYKATKGPGASKISSGIGGSGIDSGILNSLVATSSLTAKNSMSLPMMARDMNLMKLNIFKLVKLQGGKANTNKTDIFWKNAKDREAEYGNTIGKGGGTGIADVAGGVLTASVLKTLLTSTLSFLTGPIGLTMLGGAALFGTIKTLMDKNADKEGVDLTKNILGGALDDSQSGAEIMAAAAEGEAQRKKEDEQRRTASGQLQKLPQTTLPDTGAGGGRGFVNPDLVTPGTGAGGGRGFVNPDLVTPVSSVEQVPSNAILSGSGTAWRTGTGDFVTSGTPTPAPTPAPSGGNPPSPTPMGSELGKLSAKFESAKDGPGAIGYDSKGGTSYGTYQIASKTGTMNRFLKFLDKTNPDLANQLRSAGDPNTGSKNGPFPDAWKKITAQDPKGFDKLQHDFIQKTHYDPAARELMKLGFNINEQSAAMKDVLWSTSVQHGSGGAVEIFSKAIRELGVSASPEKLINKIYQERGTKFGSSTESVQKSVLNRFSEESKIALASLKTGPSVSPSMPSTGTAVASASTSVSDQRMAAMAPSGGNTVINNKPTTVASTTPSSGGKTASTYDNELFQTLVGYQSMGA